MKTVDLRSDTVTRPSPEMRAAMLEAEVGDDVLGDDPTVLALQERAAAVLGKDAALYLPSGTQCSQAAVRATSSAGTGSPTRSSGLMIHFAGQSPASVTTCRRATRPRSSAAAAARLPSVRPSQMLQAAAAAPATSRWSWGPALPPPGRSRCLADRRAARRC